MINLRAQHSVLLVFGLLLITLTLSAHAADKKPNDVLLSTMQAELDRATAELGKLNPAPYFLSYQVQDETIAAAAGGDGALLSSLRTRRRAVDVITHIGTPALDNTHENSRPSAPLSLSRPHKGSRAPA